MKEHSLKVFVNSTLTGDLLKENDQYVFNYGADAKKLVSLTMPLRSTSWSPRPYILSSK